MRKNLLESLARTLPPTFSRTTVPHFMPGLISAGHLSNLNSRGLGPDGLRVGKKVVYEKHNFLAWLENYLADREIISPNPVAEVATEGKELLK